MQLIMLIKFNKDKYIFIKLKRFKHNLYYYNIMNHSYIYLLQEREFIIANLPIYKIGKTSQINLSRFSNYPKGSKLLLQSDCNNCNLCESLIIKYFISKYKQIKSIGNEYFIGNYIEMIDDINDIIKKNRIYDKIEIDYDKIYNIYDSITGYKTNNKSQKLYESYLNLSLAIAYIP